MAGEIIATTNAPGAIGPYSQAIKTDGYLFSAGQIPLDPSTGQIVDGGIEEQTHRVMKNLAAVLSEGGSSFAEVIKTTCFLADLGDFAIFNEIYASYMGDSRPARSTVQVAALPAGAQVEVECIAKCE